MVVYDRIALQIPLYFRGSLRRFGAELVLWADSNDMMFNAGIPIRLESPGSRYSFCHGSSFVWLSPAYRSNITSVSPHNTTFRVIRSTGFAVSIPIYLLLSLPRYLPTFPYDGPMAFLAMGPNVLPATMIFVER